MGFTQSAYHFYGLHVPADQWSEAYAHGEGELVDTVIHAVKDLAPDVRWMAAGKYDEDMLFLTIYRPGVSSEIEIGEFRLVTEQTVRDLRWDAQLLAVADAMGYRKIGRPGWITLPDVS